MLDLLLLLEVLFVDVVLLEKGVRGVDKGELLETRESHTALLDRKGVVIGGTDGVLRVLREVKLLLEQLLRYVGRDIDVPLLDELDRFLQKLFLVEEVQVDILEGDQVEVVEVFAHDFAFILQVLQRVIRVLQAVVLRGWPAGKSTATPGDEFLDSERLLRDLDSALRVLLRLHDVDILDIENLVLVLDLVDQHQVCPASVLGVLQCCHALVIDLL